MRSDQAHKNDAVGSFVFSNDPIKTNKNIDKQNVPNR
jgi:hypothetical protein